MKLHALAAALLILSFALPAYAFQARVVRVIDGDTIAVLDAEKVQTRIRLAQIDAPEHNQPYGAKSKQVLSDLVFGKTIEIEPVTKDRYGRTIAELKADGRSVNREMVGAGAAWAYRKYLTDPTLLDVEADARTHRRGLWGLQADQVTPPWKWRLREKTGSTLDTASPSGRNFAP